MKSKLDRMISKIDLMVLGLVLEKPMHGYEINQILNSEEMQCWLDISRTSIYYALTRLKKQGLIAEVVEKQYNKPDRSVYRITEEGRTLFFDSLALSLAEQEKVFLDYNIGLFFLNKLTKEKASDVLERRKRFLKKWRSALNENLKLATNGSKHPSTLKAVVEHTLSFADQELSWLNGFLESVKGSAPGSDGPSVFSLSGDLSEVQLPDVIRTIASGERTGVLNLEHGPEKIGITFVGGTVSYITGPADLPLKGGDNGSEGMKTIPKEVIKAFNWPTGSFVFIPDIVESEGGLFLEAPSCELIFAGCRHVDDWGRIRKVISSADTIYEITGSQGKYPENVSLSKEEMAVLGQINGLRDVERLAEIIAMSMFDVSRVLYTFVICGLVTTVSKDKGELFDFLSAFSDAVFERLTAIKAEKIAQQVEIGLNSLADERDMPFSLRNHKLTDNMNVPQDFKEFLHSVKDFYSAQVETVRSQLGNRFTGHMLESIVGQLTPEMYDIYRRHGFNTIGQKSAKE